MIKNFDDWNKLKKKIDKKELSRELFFHEREVWWCSAGINIGVEINGKNKTYERPFLIIKKFNQHMLWVLPLTTKNSNSNYYYKIQNETDSYICISQIKTISTKRLLRKIYTINAYDFIKINKIISSYFKTKTAD